MVQKRLIAWALGIVLLWCAAMGAAQEPGPLENAPGWIREDIEAGYTLAKETGKPLLVVFT